MATQIDEATGEILQDAPRRMTIMPSVSDMALMTQNALISLTEQIYETTRTALDELSPQDAALRIKMLQDFEEILVPKLHDRAAKIEAHNNLVASVWDVELWIGNWLLRTPKQHGARGIGTSGVLLGNPTQPPRLSDYHITKKQSARWQKWARALGDEYRDVVEELLIRAQVNVYKNNDNDMEGRVKESDPTQDAGADIPDAPEEYDLYELGDMVQIGNHLFICEDNTSPLVCDLLTANAPYPLAFCDIPYNANVADWDRGGFVWTQDYLADLADIVAVTPGIGNLHTFMQQTQMPYAWSTSTHISNGMTRGALGFGNWIYTALFSQQESIHRNAQDASTVAISSKDADETGAKRQKPPRYLVWMFSLLTSEGDCIVDAFAGSGTSAIVADRLKRKSINIERDPESFSRLVARVSRVIEQPINEGEPHADAL